MTKDTTPPEAVEAAVAEAAGTPRAILLGGRLIEIPRKFKRFKFMRGLSSGDIGRCLEAIWQPVPVVDDGGVQKKDPITGDLMFTEHPTILLLDDLDLDEDEFNQAMERIGAAVAGASLGNSSTSPAS